MSIRNPQNGKLLTTTIIGKEHLLHFASHIDDVIKRKKKLKLFFFLYNKGKKKYLLIY